MSEQKRRWEVGVPRMLDNWCDLDTVAPIRLDGFTTLLVLDNGRDDRNALAADVARKLNTYDDLLAACEELVADVLSHATYGLNEKEVAMLRRAESAITKAKGGV